jgi:NTE family protein
MSNNFLHANKYKQRALIFQGGGALGAYEAGVFREIYRKILRDQEEKGNNNQEEKGNNNINLFDIVAGTSIGAINATVLVGHFLKNNNNWEGSSEKLIDFWKGLMSPTFADIFIGKNPFINNWWDYLHNNIDPAIADADIARRFWSIFQFAFTLSGVPNMYFSVPHYNHKFLNPFTDLLPWWRYDYSPLGSYLEKFVDFPIKTCFEKAEPRLLLVSVDVQDYTSAVVFDSYKKQHDARDPSENIIEGEWYSEYGHGQNKHLVFYDGIGLDQVLASTLGKYALNHPSMEDRITKTQRQFWDGGYHSNTPLRQLILDHRKYWYEYLKRKDKREEEITNVPDLEVYIVNLHPSIMKNIPGDRDLIDDREHDILFHDRTNFDEHIAYLVSDYVDLAGELIELARLNGLADHIDQILNKAAKGFSRNIGKLKKYKDIIEGRFDITKVWRIDRSEDSGDTFGKTTNFSSTSIIKLIEDGQKDARISLNSMEIVFSIQDLIHETIISEQEGRALMEKIKEVVPWAGLSYVDKKRVINNLHEFIFLVNDTNTKKKLSAKQRQSLINSVSNIINQLELSPNY